MILKTNKRTTILHQTRLPNLRFRTQKRKSIFLGNIHQLEVNDTICGIILTIDLILFNINTAVAKFSEICNMEIQNVCLLKFIVQPCIYAV